MYFVDELNKYLPESNPLARVMDEGPLI